MRYIYEVWRNEKLVYQTNDFDWAKWYRSLFGGAVLANGINGKERIE